MMTIDRAQTYIGRGWAVLPIPHRAKRPAIEGWQNLRITATDAPHYFFENGAPQNIGVLLGEPSNSLTDLDMDWREVVQLARHFCPETLIFGRSGNVSSHALVRCVGAVTKKFSLPEEHGGMVLELRSTGCQTVMPGSTHPSGEAIEFENDAEIIEIPRDKLEARCAHWASAAVLLRYWTKGHRDELAATLAALLLRAGWKAEHVDRYIEYIATAAGDDNVRDRLKAHAVEKAITKNAKTFGHKRFGEILGTTVAEKLAEWLKLRREAPEAEAFIPQTVTAAELQNKNLPAIRYVIPKLLPEGLALFVGSPKQKKSLTSIHVALALCYGGKVFGGAQVEQCDVLIMALEDNERRLKVRLSDITAGMGHTAWPANLHFVTDWPSGDVTALGKWLDEQPAVKFVVVDTLARFRPAGNSKASAYLEDYAALKGLQGLAGDRGITVFVIHHLRKMEADDPLDQISGTNGLAGCADTIWIIKRERGKAEASLFITGRDILEEQDLALTWDTQLVAWRVLGDADKYRQSEERVELIEALEDGPKTAKEMEKITGKKYHTVRAVLERMAKEGILIMEGKKYKAPGRGSDDDAPF